MSGKQGLETFQRRSSSRLSRKGSVREEPDIEVPAGDVKKGAKLYKKNCLLCHAIVKGDDVSIRRGPNLNGLWGRKSGSDCGGRQKYEKTGLGFSPSLKLADITWSDKHMYEYLVNPKTYVPGSTKNFDGLRRDQERSDLIAYLKEVL